MDASTAAGLIAAAKVAANHYGEEADYFSHEGEEDTAADYASREQEIRGFITAAEQAPEAAGSTGVDTGDELLIQIQSLLDNDSTGTVRAALWDLVETTEESPF